MILGIQGAFNTKAGFVFPTHEDFKLIQWKDRREYLGKPDAFIQSNILGCLLYTSPSPRDGLLSRMPSSA